MDFKHNNLAAACTLLLKEAGPEIASKNYQNIWRNRVLHATLQTKYSSSIDVCAYMRILNSLVLFEENTPNEWLENLSASKKV